MLRRCPLYINNVLLASFFIIIAELHSASLYVFHYMKKTFLTLLLAVVAMAGVAQTNQNDVLALAFKANTYFMQKHPDPTKPTFVNKVRSSNLWTRAVYYEGLMDLLSIKADKESENYVDAWANFHKWTARNGVEATNADDQCCEQIYIERALQLGKPELLKNTGINLDHQIATGRNNYWTWIDAIQMAMPIYAKYYKVTGEQKYLDYAMSSYLWTRDTLAGGLFDTKSGLWFRDKDYVPPYKEKDGNNCYWSRGNGWVYAALVRVMEQLPQNSKAYKKLKKDFILMTKGLAKCQRADGYWNASLVSPVTYGGPELTGTGLFLYGMSWGLRNGLIGKEYRANADKAWTALSKCVHPDGFLGWVQGTGKDPSAGQPVTYTSVPDFEDFGTGCFLLGASEYYKLLNSENKK